MTAGGGCLLRLPAKETCSQGTGCCGLADAFRADKEIAVGQTIAVQGTGEQVDRLVLADNR